MTKLVYHLRGHLTPGGEGPPGPGPLPGSAWVWGIFVLYAVSISSSRYETVGLRAQCLDEQVDYNVCYTLCPLQQNVEFLQCYFNVVQGPVHKQSQAI